VYEGIYRVGFQLKLNSKRKIVLLILLSIGIIVVESKETMEGAHMLCYYKLATCIRKLNSDSNHWLHQKVVFEYRWSLIQIAL